MTKNRLIAGVALIVLLVLVGAIAAFVVDQEQPPETVTSLSIRGKVIVDAYHYDEATGEYVHFYHYEGSNLITDIGKDWIEGLLGVSPAGDPAKWISLSADTSVPGAGWSQLEDAGEVTTEINTGGLSRALGAYSDQTTGAWNIAATFDATATFTVRLSGLQWSVTSQSDDNLLAVDNLDPVVTVNDGDTLTVTWQLSIP